MKEIVCVCVCACACACAVEDRGVGEAGGVFVAFNPGQWDCKGQSERVLFELMKRKPFTLLYKDTQLSLRYGFSLSFQNRMKQNRTKYFICSALLTVVLLSS